MRFLVVLFLSLAACNCGPKPKKVISSADCKEMSKDGCK